MAKEKEPKDGYIFDFISGQEIKATPEEIEATQVFAKRLIDEYEFKKEDIQTGSEGSRVRPVREDRTLAA